MSWIAVPGRLPVQRQSCTSWQTATQRGVGLVPRVEGRLGPPRLVMRPGDGATQEPEIRGETMRTGVRLSRRAVVVGSALGLCATSWGVALGRTYRQPISTGEVNAVSSDTVPPAVGPARPIRIVQTATVWQPQLVRSADLDVDGIVGTADRDRLLDHWRSQDSSGDLDGDGHVDGKDLALLLGAWTER